MSFSETTRMVCGWVMLSFAGLLLSPILRAEPISLQALVTVNDDHTTASL
jgi:hypothetical protein